MKNTALLRSIPFWLLLVLSLAAIGIGGWIATDQIGVMTTTLLDGTATGVEVYAGQAWVVLAGALLAGGVIGLFLALALAAARALLPRPAVEVVEAIDWTAQGSDDDESESADPTGATEAETSDTSSEVDAEQAEPAITR
ncbi:hypothetical protein ACWGJP_10920 [Microbacterium sp. NPDC055903]